MTSRTAVKRLFDKAIVVILIMLLCGTSLAVPAKGATQTAINDAIADGVAYLVSQQNVDGSWPGGFAADTGFALAVLEHNAEHLGTTPLDSNYLYHTNVQNGLNYLFSSAFYDVGNGWVYWNVPTSYNAYQSGPCLMGIARSGAPGAIVSGTSNGLNGKTYFQVAQMVVDWLGSAQVKSGNGTGAWYYRKDPTLLSGDQSATGWATMGLGYAVHSMGCTWPVGLLDRLALWNEYIQYHTPGADFGGAGYMGPGSWTNTYKTGHLLFCLGLTGATATSPRVLDALTFMDTHWNDLTNGYNSWNSFGWRGNPPEELPSYIATVAATKGFTELGIETFNGHNWYDDFADVIVTNQWPDGHWLGGGYGEFENVRSTCWALLTLLRATSHVPPTVSTRAADSLCMNTVTLNGYLTNMGTAGTTSVSFQYGTVSGVYPHETAAVVTRTAPRVFSADVTGLTTSTTYFFRAKAEGDAVAYGDELSFKTTDHPCTPVDLLPPMIRFPDFAMWSGVSGASGTGVPDSGNPAFTVNRSPFDLQFTIEDDSASGVRWTLSVDGRIVTSSDGTGTFTRPLPLFEGRNDVVVTAVDGAGNTASRHIGITLDTHAPVVTLAGTLQSMVTGTTLNVEGAIKDEVSGVRSLTIDGTEVFPYLDGTFTASLPVKRGLNTIEVETLDKAGNGDSFTWTLDLTPVAQPRVRRTIDLTVDSTLMVVDGTSVTMDVAPVIREDRTLLPLRALVKELGGSVAWNAKTGQVTVKARGITMVLTIGKNTATVNGMSTFIDPANNKVVPVIIGGRTFLPVRFIAEQLGLEIGWYPPTRTITITWEP
jgi:hypothetical protein